MPFQFMWLDEVSRTWIKYRLQNSFTISSFLTVGIVFHLKLLIRMQARIILVLQSSILFLCNLSENLFLWKPFLTPDMHGKFSVCNERIIPLCLSEFLFLYLHFPLWCSWFSCENVKTCNPLVISQFTQCHRHTFLLFWAKVIPHF